MSRNKAFILLAWSIVGGALTYGGAMMNDHIIISIVILVAAVLLLTITVELENMNAYERGRLDGYRTLISEVINKHGVDDGS